MEYKKPKTFDNVTLTRIFIHLMQKKYIRKNKIKLFGSLDNDNDYDFV